MPARLILICGLPGSGKTTLARLYESELGAVRLCPDEWLEALEIGLWEGDVRARIEALQWTLAQRLLSLGQTVIIEWGLWARSERDVLRIGARALGATVDLHVLHETIDVLFDRIHRRDMESPPITREQLVEWSAIFETPTPEEFAEFDSADGRF